MGRYIVKFSKKVISDHGREVDALQFTYETIAPDEAAARARAEQEFCNVHQLSCWQNHADRVEVLAAEFPS